MSTQIKELIQTQHTGEERRASQRVRRYKPAKLAFKNKNDNQTVVDCMLRDISVTGARVRLKSLFDGPKLVVLGVIGDFTRSADVMWYRNNELGLRFRDEV